MQTECSPALFAFAPVEGRAVVAGFDGGAITSDAGALLLGATDRSIGLVRRFAACFTDARDPERVEHGITTLVGQRVFGIALGYEDLLDHDRLRRDPALAVLAGKLAARRPDCAPLAGKSTLNRLEHAPAGGPGRYHRIGHDAAASKRCSWTSSSTRTVRPRGRSSSTSTPPTSRCTGTKRAASSTATTTYCYLPLYVFCGRHLLAAKLRRSNIDGSAGAMDEVERIVRRIRARWPRVRILLRADSGFAREPLMAWCEANRVDFVFGLARNPRLVEEIATDLAWAEDDAARAGRRCRACWSRRRSTRPPWGGPMSGSPWRQYRPQDSHHDRARKPRSSSSRRTGSIGHVRSGQRGTGAAGRDVAEIGAGTGPAPEAAGDIAVIRATRSGRRAPGARGTGRARRDPPPMKWSVLRYGFEPEEDRDGEEGAQARGDRGQAAAGGRSGVAGPERG